MQIYRSHRHWYPDMSLPWFGTVYTNLGPGVADVHCSSKHGYPRLPATDRYIHP